MPGFVAPRATCASTSCSRRVNPAAFASVLRRGPRGQASAMSVDAPEHVADKILEAVQTEAAEVYTDNLRSRFGQR